MRGTGLIKSVLSEVLTAPTSILDIQILLAGRNITASARTVLSAIKELVEEQTVRRVGTYKKRGLYQLTAAALAAKQTLPAAAPPMKPLSFFPRLPQRTGGWNAERAPKSFDLKELQLCDSVTPLSTTSEMATGAALKTDTGGQPRKKRPR